MANRYRFKTDADKLIKNWPQQNYDNGTAKNDRTLRNFKRLVRILKRIRYNMEDEGIDAAKNIPSFLIECLVWNVPDEGFLHSTYTEDVRFVLAHTFNATMQDKTCSEWVETNRLKSLFCNSQPWRRDEVNRFLDAAWNYAGFE